jgi:hypothetical protein
LESLLGTIGGQDYELLLVNTYFLSKNISKIPSGNAYAVLFAAQGEGRYASLGPSFIITANSDPREVHQHLRDNHHYACDSSNGTFDEIVVCRFKYLGSISSVKSSIITTQLGGKVFRSPKGDINRLIRLSMPLFDYRDIHRNL